MASESGRTCPYCASAGVRNDATVHKLIAVLMLAAAACVFVHVASAGGPLWHLVLPLSFLSLAADRLVMLRKQRRHCVSCRWAWGPWSHDIGPRGEHDELLGGAYESARETERPKRHRASLLKALREATELDPREARFVVDDYLRRHEAAGRAGEAH